MAKPSECPKPIGAKIEINDAVRIDPIDREQSDRESEEQSEIACGLKVCILVFQKPSRSISAIVSKTPASGF